MALYTTDEEDAAASCERRSPLPFFVWLLFFIICFIPALTWRLLDKLSLFEAWSYNGFILILFSVSFMFEFLGILSMLSSYLSFTAWLLPKNLLSTKPSDIVFIWFESRLNAISLYLIVAWTWGYLFWSFFLRGYSSGDKNSSRGLDFWSEPCSWRPIDIELFIASTIFLSLSRVDIKLDFYFELLAAWKVV